MSTRQRPLDGDLVRRLVNDPGPWLSCDDCFRLLDIYVDAAIRDHIGAEFAAMTNHLEMCQACREEAQTLVQLAAADSGVDEGEVFARGRLYTSTTSEQAFRPF
jgi:hypothetical protein